MNYLLSSTRKIGTKIQKITTTQLNAPEFTQYSDINRLSKWHILFDSFDPPGRTVGTIKYTHFNKTDSPYSNTGSTKIRGIISVVNNDLDYILNHPHIITFPINDVTEETFYNAIDSAFVKLCGLNIYNVNCYIVGANLEVY